MPYIISYNKICRRRVDVECFSYMIYESHVYLWGILNVYLYI